MSDELTNPRDRRSFLRGGLVGAAAASVSSALTANGDEKPWSTDRAKDRWMSGKPSVLIFDVNETLIDFEVMHPLFERVFGDKRALREWLRPPVMVSHTLPPSGAL